MAWSVDPVATCRLSFSRSSGLRGRRGRGVGPGRSWAARFWSSRRAAAPRVTDHRRRRPRHPRPHRRPTPPPPPPPPRTAQITITANGISPKEVTVARGGRVTFVNDDGRPHDVFSDPDHLGTDCPAINVVGFLTAGRSGETGPLDIVAAVRVPRSPQHLRRFPARHDRRRRGYRNFIGFAVMAILGHPPSSLVARSEPDQNRSNRRSIAHGLRPAKDVTQSENRRYPVTGSPAPQPADPKDSVA